MIRFLSTIKFGSMAVFAVFAIIGGTLASIDWRASNPAADSSGADLDISPAELDLGEVWLQKELSFRVAVRNSGRRPVRVLDFSASCNCTEVTPNRFVLPPAGAAVVHGLIDLTRSVHDPQSTTSPFEVTLTAQTAEQEVSWPLRGIARRGLDVSPASINLVGANEVIAGTWSPTIEVKIVPRIEIVQLKPEWNAAEAEIELTGPDFDGQYLLRYTPDVNQPVGEIHTRINLLSRVSDENEGPEIQIPVTGFIQPPVRLSTPRVILEESTPGRAHDRNAVIVEIVPLDGRTWQVIDIHNDFTGIIVDIGSGNSITFHATSGSPNTEQLVRTVDVTLSQGNGETWTVPLEILVVKPIH